MLESHAALDAANRKRDRPVERVGGAFVVFMKCTSFIADTFPTAATAAVCLQDAPTDWGEVILGNASTPDQSSLAIRRIARCDAWHAAPVA